MMERLKKWTEDVFTEPGIGNRTVCPIRVLAIAGSLQYLGLSLANYIQHHVFDPQAFAIGLGALLAGVGAALGMKRDTAAPK